MKLQKKHGDLIHQDSEGVCKYRGELSYYSSGILIKAQFCGLKHTNKQGVI